jgi:hypothetical protein
LIARLQRFYGGDPMAWLNMPGEVLRAYATNLAKIQAGEALASITYARIADAGTMKLTSARQAAQRLEKATAPQKRPADPRRLRAAGIKVEHRSARR